MSNLYRGPSMEASCQVSVHLAKRFRGEDFYFRNLLTMQKQELPMEVMFVNGSKRNEQS
jgi:hypothetical protein